MSSVRRYVSPRLLMPGSSFDLPPLEFCLGINSSQDNVCLILAKQLASAIEATLRPHPKCARLGFG